MVTSRQQTLQKILVNIDELFMPFKIEYFAVNMVSWLISQLILVVKMKQVPVSTLLQFLSKKGFYAGFMARGKTRERGERLR